MVPGDGSDILLVSTPSKTQFQIQNPIVDTNVNKAQAMVIEAPKDNEIENYLDLCDIAHPEPSLPNNSEENN